MEQTPIKQTKKISNDARLVESCNLAVRQRRSELNERKNKILFIEKYNEWKSYNQLALHEVTELQQIDNELKIIENLMIKTQQIYQKMGGKIQVEIRRSDIPDSYYDSLNEVEN